MVTNRLHLSNRKAGILFTGTPTLIREIPVSIVRFGDDCIVPSDVVCFFGVMLDSTLTIEQQVSVICTYDGLHLDNIAKIVGYLTPRATELSVNVFITSRFDSCNILLPN